MRALTSTKLAEVLDAVYSAGMDVLRWPDAVASVSKLFPEAAIALQVVEASPTTQPAATYLEHNFERGALQSYARCHLQTSPWLSAHRQAKVGVPYFSSSICPSETFIHTEFFDQWIKLYRVPCGAAAVKIFEEHGRLATLSLNYDEQRCERMDKEVGLFLKLLLPHLQRAILLNHQVRAANLTTARFEGLVAAIKWPALIVGLGCRLILANQGAQDALRRARGLILRSNYRLTLKYRADAELFRQLVYAALSPNPGHLTPRSMNFSADGESGPNVLELTPLTRECILVTIRYSDDKLNTDMMLLRDSFRLTAAECEVATKLACGFSLTTIAGDTGRSIHTVRLHLKRALAKTQCHSQAQLVRLLWSLHGTGI